MTTLDVIIKVFAISIVAVSIVHVVDVAKEEQV
jgi:hypothetical protein